MVLGFDQNKRHRTSICLTDQVLDEVLICEHQLNTMMKIGMRFIDLVNPLEHRLTATQDILSR